MADVPFSTPVEDSVPRAGDIAVGEDLRFQRRWWVFERMIWSFFLLLLVADCAGLFGRGWAAKARLSNNDHTLTLDYERVERSGTPSVMTLRLAPEAIHDGSISLYVSEDIIRPLGAQRISPQPLESTLAPGGVVYRFPAIGAPATVEFQMQPSFPGNHPFQIGFAEGGDQERLHGTIFVLP